MNAEAERNPERRNTHAARRLLTRSPPGWQRRGEAKPALDEISPEYGSESDRLARTVSVRQCWAAKISPGRRYRHRQLLATSCADQPAAAYCGGYNGIRSRRAPLPATRMNNGEHCQPTIRQQYWQQLHASICRCYSSAINHLSALPRRTLPAVQQFSTSTSLRRDIQPFSGARRTPFLGSNPPWHRHRSDRKLRMPSASQTLPDHPPLAGNLASRASPGISQCLNFSRYYFAQRTVGAINPAISPSPFTPPVAPDNLLRLRGNALFRLATA